MTHKIGWVTGKYQITLPNEVLDFIPFSIEHIWSGNFDLFRVGAVMGAMGQRSGQACGLEGPGFVVADSGSAVAFAASFAASVQW